MALKIRLTRLGDRGNAFYRVVVTESRSARDGEYIEQLGTYDPKGTAPDSIKIDKEKTLAWVAKGAQATDTAHALLVKAGILPAEQFKPKANAKPPKPAVEKKKKEKKAK